MIRRILTAAMGGIAALALLYIAMSELHALGLLLFIARLWPMGLFTAIAGGGAAMWAAEKLNLIPTDQQLNQKLGPVRLFDERNVKP